MALYCYFFEEESLFITIRLKLQNVERMTCRVRQHRVSEMNKFPKKEEIVELPSSTPTNKFGVCSHKFRLQINFQLLFAIAIQFSKPKPKPRFCVWLLPAKVLSDLPLPRAVTKTDAHMHDADAVAHGPCSCLLFCQIAK